MKSKKTLLIILLLLAAMVLPTASAFSQEDVINKYKTIGAFEVIQKPFDSKRLKQVIEKAIKN